MFRLVSRDGHQLLAWLLVVAAVPLLTAACNSHRQTCGCGVGRGGCHITGAAQPGFKCQCDYYCNGVAHPCRNNEACPGGRYSYCACEQAAESHCGAYRRRSSTKKSCANVNKVDASLSLKRYSYKECECDYFSNVGDWGCRIVEPAAEGFKCVCEYSSAAHCHGWSIGCDEDEYCPADSYDYCACQRGGGNCGGYHWDDREEDCNLGSTCDCDRSTDWTKGRYSIDDVNFNNTGIVRGNQQIIHVGHALEIPNASGSEQSSAMSVAETLRSETKFEYTHGMRVSFGIEFGIKYKGLGLSLSQSVEASHSFTYGETTTVSNEFSHVFTCTSPPYTLIRCMVSIISYDVAVPYTMSLKHNTIPDCVCKSFGIMRGMKSYEGKIIPVPLSSCYYLHSNGTCATHVANSCGPRVETTWYRGLKVALSLWVIHGLFKPKIALL